MARREVLTAAVRFGHAEQAASAAKHTGDMPEVESWHQQQINLIKADRKTTDPHGWKNAKYGSIKSKMTKMGRTKEEYYPELSDRLNMKKPFTSLKKLSKHDLGRVDGMVKRDYEKWRK